MNEHGVALQRRALVERLFDVPDVQHVLVQAQSHGRREVQGQRSEAKV